MAAFPMRYNLVLRNSIGSFACVGSQLPSLTILQDIWSPDLGISHSSSISDCGT